MNIIEARKGAERNDFGAAIIMPLCDWLAGPNTHEGEVLVTFAT